MGSDSGSVYVNEATLVLKPRRSSLHSEPGPDAAAWPAPAGSRLGAPHVPCPLSSPPQPPLRVAGSALPVQQWERLWGAVAGAPGVHSSNPSIL